MLHLDFPPHNQTKEGFNTGAQEDGDVGKEIEREHLCKDMREGKCLVGLILPSTRIKY